MLAGVAYFVSVAALVASQPCRDRFLHPFSSTSIWNTPIGSGAQYAPANLFSNLSAPLGSRDGPPYDFHNDQDFVVRASASDPLTPWLNQGDWGGGNHCTVVSPTPAALIPFPASFLSTSGSAPPWQMNNNAMGLLLPDNRTVVQMQPVYRCAVGGPLLARWGNDTDGCPQNFPNVTDIFGDGNLGAHGGSGLSGIGGTIRLGELSAGIPHALKIELFSGFYYYGVKPLQPASAYNGNRLQYIWPATGSDSCSQFPNQCYGGTNPFLAPGALLAIPPALAAQVVTTTMPGARIKDALISYGAYIVDDTANPDAAICLEAGVNAEMQALFNVTMAYPGGIRPTDENPVARDLYTDLLNIFRALHVVVNNSPSSIGGGGTPLAPLAPPICE